MDQYDTDLSRGSTPRLPPIDTGYDTPGSDYMSAIRHKPRHSSMVQSDIDNDMKMPAPSSISSISKSHTGTNSERYSKGNGTSKKLSSHGSACSRNHEHASKPNDTNLTQLTLNTSKRKSLPREVTIPATNGSKHSALKKKSSSDMGAYNPMLSPLKLSLPGSASTKFVSAASTPDGRKRSWHPPKITTERYEEAKARIMDGGKFKARLKTYFREDVPWWETKSDSEDDGYDTDLDKQLGFELIADEKSREILQDGAFPEYKQECRKFRSNPNTYFMRHCLEDNVQMRHRYLSKGDSITISNLIKNHLTVNTLDLEDNGIGPHGMKYFRNVLHENKHLNELYLSRNNLGPIGAKYLRAALVSNCFIRKLDISENNFGEKGGKYCAGIIEDNVSLKELNIAGNGIGDNGAILISKALGNNVSLKLINISWNKIRAKGAVKLAEVLKKNTELEVFIAGVNGFADEGGRAIVNAMRQTNAVTELDLSNNRMTDTVLKLIGTSMDSLSNLEHINVAHNRFTSKAALDFFALLVARPGAVKHVNLEGVAVVEGMNGLCSALQSAHNIQVEYKDPPSQREVTTDILTTNLVILAEFLEGEEIDFEDLFPDWEDEDDEGSLMLTTNEVISALECCGKITRFEKLQKLRAKVKYGKNRKFSISEFLIVYDGVISGKDPLREMPLRTHLRRSIKEEREELERKSKQKKRYGSILSSTTQSEKVNA